MKSLLCSVVCVCVFVNLSQLICAETQECLDNEKWKKEMDDPSFEKQMMDKMITNCHKKNEGDEAAGKKCIRDLLERLFTASRYKDYVTPFSKDDNAAKIYSDVIDLCDPDKQTEKPFFVCFAAEIVKHCSDQEPVLNEIKRMGYEV